MQNMGLKHKRAITISDGKRYFDNVLEGTAREVKSGPITLSGSKQQILKDIEILEEGLTKDINKVEWHCFNGVDDNVETFVKQELKNRKMSENLFIIKRFQLFRNLEFSILE